MFCILATDSHIHLLCTQPVVATAAIVQRKNNYD